MSENNNQIIYKVSNTQASFNETNLKKYRDNDIVIPGETENNADVCANILKESPLYMNEIHWFVGKTNVSTCRAETVRIDDNTNTITGKCLNVKEQHGKYICYIQPHKDNKYNIHASLSMFITRIMQDIIIRPTQEEMKTKPASLLEYNISNINSVDSSLEVSIINSVMDISSYSTGKVIMLIAPDTYQALCAGHKSMNNAIPHLYNTPAYIMPHTHKQINDLLDTSHKQKIQAITIIPSSISIHIDNISIIPFSWNPEHEMHPELTYTSLIHYRIQYGSKCGIIHSTNA